MKIPRWLHRTYAWLFGYFWLPCPMCGTMIGGHEARLENTLTVKTIRDESGRAVAAEGHGVCAACGPEARRITEAMGFHVFGVNR